MKNNYHPCNYRNLQGAKVLTEDLSIQSLVEKINKDATSKNEVASKDKN